MSTALRLADVAAEDPARPFGRLVEAEQRMDQRRLASTVRPEQPDRPARKRAGQPLQRLHLAEVNAEVLELDDGIHGPHYATIEGGVSTGSRRPRGVIPRVVVRSRPRPGPLRLQRTLGS